MKARIVLIVGIALTIVALSWSSAQAGGGVRIGIGLPIGIGVGVGPAYPPPYYYRPYPYYYPPAYYYGPYPYGYAAPAPVYVQPAPAYGSRRQHLSNTIIRRRRHPRLLRLFQHRPPPRRAYRHRHRFRKQWPLCQKPFSRHPPSPPVRAGDQFPVRVERPIGSRNRRLCT